MSIQQDERMTGLAETILRLSQFRGGPSAAGMSSRDTPLAPLTAFGSNPGQLGARAFVPEAIASGAALVVVLHGCTQTADSYDRGSGWSDLARKAGFAVLFPEQQRTNNANLCFNWFEPGNVARGQGELLSIVQMVRAMIARHGLDASRVFVTGLSAGGAMTSALLAAYPDVFAGGAVIAGLPFDTATGIPEALQRMRAAGPVRTEGLPERLVATTGHDGRFPILSVWHGDADCTVHVSNAAAIVAQWRAIHRVDTVAVSERVGRHSRRVWRDAVGRDVIESWTIVGMGHGTPVATSGADACGAVGPHMLEAGISSTRHIARFWGLLDSTAGAGAVASSEIRAASGPKRGGERGILGDGGGLPRAESGGGGVCGEEGWRGGAWVSASVGGGPAATESDRSGCCDRAGIARGRADEVIGDGGQEE